jgi:hypothetical protein
MSSTFRDVRDIKADKKQALEELLGESLAENAQLFIASFTPGLVPDEATRHAALVRLREQMDKSHAYVAAQGTTERDADESLEEALRRVRYGEP